MKYIPLIMVFLGIALFWHGISSGRESSFNDGTFLIQIFEMLAGVGCFAVGVVWLLVLGFMAL